MMKHIFILCCALLIPAVHTFAESARNSGHLNTGSFANREIVAPDSTQKSTHKKTKKAHSNHEKNYSKYNTIFELIRSEIPNVKVQGNNVYTYKVSSISLSPEVLYEVDGFVVSDISFIKPIEVERIEYIDGSSASAYGSRGGNGVIRITLRK